MMNTLMYDLFNEIFKTGNWGVTQWFSEQSTNPLKPYLSFIKAEANERSKHLNTQIWTQTGTHEPANHTTTTTLERATDTR